MDESIKIQNAGPVEALEVPIPEKGGLVIIRGMNDCGKSETLKAIKRLLGSDDKISRRYGTPAGVVEGLGAVVRLLSNVRQTGEAEAWSLESRLDLASLVDPGINDPVAADRARTKALLSIRGVGPDQTLFYDLLGGDFAFHATVSAKTLAAGDLVGMAAGVKKDLEVAARKATDQAHVTQGEAQACRQAAEGVDPSVEQDAIILQRGLEDRISDAAAIRRKRVDAQAAKAAADKARVKLAESERTTGPGVVEAEKSLRSAVDIVTKAEAASRTAQCALADAITAREVAHATLQGARGHAALTIAWSRAMGDLAKIDSPPEAEIIRADEVVTEARQALEAGALARAAGKQARKGTALLEAASKLSAQSSRLRDAAAGVQDVLAAALGSLFLIPATDDKGQFRLITGTTDDGRRIYYHDLGPGNRCTLALKEGAARVRELGAERIALLVLPQELWEGLDWKNRQIVKDCIRELGVSVVTGEASKVEGDERGIHAEVIK